MDWGKFVYLLIIILIGYLPYKVLQKKLPRGLNDISNSTALLLGAWFLILSGLLLSQIKELNVSIPTWILVAVSLTSAIWFSVPFLIRKIGVYPDKVISQKPTLFVVKFDPHTLYLKFFEVLFQQIKFLFMLSVVLVTLSPIDRTIIFTLIIGFFHFNNLFFLPKREAMVFFILSFPMAVLFSILILRGYVLLTLSIHLWFYLLFAGYPWIVNRNFSRLDLRK